MPQRLTALRVPRVSFVDRAAVRDPSNPMEPRRFVMFKSEGSVPPTPTKGAPVLTDAQKAELDPTVREMVEKAEKDAAEALAARETAEKAEKDAKEALTKAQEERDARPAAPEEKLADKLDKSDLPPALVEALEKAEAREAAAEERIKKSDEKAEKAETIAKAERDKRVTSEWVTKAETGELRGLPGAPAESGPLMKSLAEAAPEAWAEFEKSVLSPAVAQIQAGDLLKEAGRGGEGPPPESALRKMQDKATELRKSEPQISRHEAMERVRRDNPELQAQVADEIGSAGAR